VEAIKAAGDKRFGFAGAGTGHNEDIAARIHGFLLRFCKETIFFARRFHACENFSHRWTQMKHRFVARRTRWNLQANFSPLDVG